MTDLPAPLLIELFNSFLQLSLPSEFSVVTGGVIIIVVKVIVVVIMVVVAFFVVRICAGSDSRASAGVWA